MSKFKKRDGKKSVESIVKRNTGLTKNELLSPRRGEYIYNMNEAVSFFKKNKHEKITIVGDYDADGITASSILKIGLKAFGVDAEVRLPRRFSEGYGLSVKIIEEIDEGLIITVDNGIAAVEAIQAAKEKGLKVIVLDHHLTKKGENNVPILPKADIICDPSAEKLSDFNHYCGAGLAYRFAEALIPNKKRTLNDLLVLASIGTVADMMPLVGENRLIVKEGLRLINSKSGTFGLKQIMKQLELTCDITEKDYGFSLGPVINASERMSDGGAKSVFDVLTSEQNDFKATFKAANLIQVNTSRKELTKSILGGIDAMIGDKRPVVLYDNSISEGIVGLVAGRIAEQRQCPAIVFTDVHGKEGLIKGSGRSGDKVHLANALKNIQHLIEGWGGHEGAAGLVIKRENLEAFIKAFEAEVGDLPPIAESLEYDLDIDSVDFDSMMEELDKFAPYGQGNPSVVFRMKLCVDKMEYMGDGSHLKIKLPNLEITGFGLKDKYLSEGAPKKFEAIGTFSMNNFNGKTTRTFAIDNLKSL